MFKHALVLTGSIGTGKSTVCSLLKLHGYKVLDLDKISHQVIESVHRELIELFGKKVIVDEKVDRKAIGKIVFYDNEKLKQLENLIHPLIKKEVILESQKLDKVEVDYFIDIPLFFEKEGSYDIRRCVVVYCLKEIQIERVMKRDLLEYEEAKKRVELQLDIEEKREKADYIIDNSKDIGTLTQNVEKFVQKIKEESATK